MTISPNQNPDQDQLIAAAINTIYKDNPEIIKELLKKGLDVNAKNSNGQTLLYLATSYSCTKVAKCLIENGADVNARDSDGQTPLHSASKSSDVELVKLLIENGANVNAKDSDDETPLHVAAFYEQTKIAQCLIENGADFNTESLHVYRTLHLASERSNIELAKLFIENGADVNATDVGGITPLILSGSKEMVEFLLANGAKLDIKTVSKEFIELIEKAINDFNNGLNPDIDITRCSQIKKYKISDLSILHSAALYDSKALVEFLLEDKGFFVNSPDNYGRTPLYFASMAQLLFDPEINNSELIEYLITRGADVNIKDSDGNTILHKLLGGIIEILSSEHIADYFMVDREAFESLFVDDTEKAELNEGIKVLVGEVVKTKELLQKNGARDDIKNNKGETAAELEAQYQEKWQEFIAKSDINKEHDATEFASHEEISPEDLQDLAGAASPDDSEEALST